MNTLDIIKGIFMGRPRRQPRTFTIDVPVHRESEKPAREVLEEADGNRRDESRVGQICEVWYRTEEVGFRRAHAVDITSHGARLIIDLLLEPGSSFDLTFKALNGGFIAVTAQVIWASTLPGGVRHVTGVSFEARAVDQDALHDWVQSLSHN